MKLGPTTYLDAGTGNASDAISVPRFFWCSRVFARLYLDKQPALQNATFMQIHIGNLIRDELRRQGHTNEWLMDRIGVSERTLQRLFNKPSIDTQQLFLISSVLKTDFFQFYSDVISNPSNDDTRQPLTP